MKNNQIYQSIVANVKAMVGYEFLKLDEPVQFERGYVWGVAVDEKHDRIYYMTYGGQKEEQWWELRISESHYQHILTGLYRVTKELMQEYSFAQLKTAAA